MYEKMAKIQPKMRYKGDIPFEQWQQIARKKLYELLGLKYMEKCDFNFAIEHEKDCKSHIEIRFTFQSEPGYYIPCYILVPKNLSKPAPPMICVQGHSTGMHISLGNQKFPTDKEFLSITDRAFALVALKHGFCPVVIEQRYMGECGGDEQGPGCCAHGRKNTASALPSLLLGRCAIGERVWDISRLIDVISKKFSNIIDINKISCMGSSGGGTATYYATCIDERIKNAISACSVCTYKDSIVALYHCPCNYIPSIAQYFDMGDLGGLIAPRNLVVFAGRYDKIFPINGVEESMKIINKLYRHAGCEKNATLVVGDVEHQFCAEPSYNALKKLIMT